MFNKILEPKKKVVYKYAEDHGLDEPLLVLCIETTRFMDRPFKFRPGRRFINLAHQTAGHGCHQHYMRATVLRPRRNVAKKLRRLCDKWLNSDAGALHSPLDTVLEYREDLKSLLGADCNTCHGSFEEGFYPIDCTPGNLKRLCSDRLPANLDDLVSWGRGRAGAWNRLLGCIGRWSLVVLGENCD